MHSNNTCSLLPLARFIVILAAVIYTGCSPETPVTASGEGLVGIGEIEQKGFWITIQLTIHNSTAGDLSLSRNGWVKDFTLEKYVAGQWKEAAVIPRIAVGYAPYILAPGGSVETAVRIDEEAHLIVAETPGTYRIIYGLTDTETDALLPVEQRASPTFTLK